MASPACHGRHLTFGRNSPVGGHTLELLHDLEEAPRGCADYREARHKCGEAIALYHNHE